MIVFSNLGDSSGMTAVNPDILDTTDSLTYSNSAWTPPGGLIICYIFAGSGHEPSVTGNGLSWILIISTLYQANTRGLSLWAADGAGATNGTNTITFGGTQLACYAMFFEAIGVDISEGVASAFISNDGSGIGTSGSIALNPPQNLNNRPIACFSHDADEVVTERANWAKFDDLHGSAPTNGMICERREDIYEVTASASWAGNVAWGGIASELKAEATLAEGTAPSIEGYGAM